MKDACGIHVGRDFLGFGMGERNHDPALGELASLAEGRLETIEGDAIKIDLTDLAPTPRAIVANLPYNIATALLVRWLTTEPWPPWFDTTIASAPASATTRASSGVWMPLTTIGPVSRSQMSPNGSTILP